MTTKYEPLCSHLRKEAASQISLTFAEIERLLGATLPASAKRYEAWWANERSEDTRHVQCRAWRDAGYVALPDLVSQAVTFQKY
jgi:hypothetical protein